MKRRLDPLPHNQLNNIWGGVLVEMQELAGNSRTLIPELTIMKIHNNRDDITFLKEIY